MKQVSSIIQPSKSSNIIRIRSASSTVRLHKKGSVYAERDESISTTSITTRTLKKKKRRKTKSVISESDDDEREEYKKITKKSSFDMPGVTKLILSEISQKIVECVVGDDVSAENPWTYIKKEKILDNIDLHDESSEFLDIRHKIKTYPESTILIGWIPAASDKYDEFYIVYTVEAKEKVLKIIARHKAEMTERLKKMVDRPIGEWFSLGSEREVNQALIKNHRPLYRIEINCRYPLFTNPIKFHMRKVEDIRDGYVELLQDIRYPIENIEKKRVDVSVQAALPRCSNATQTDIKYPINMATQYEFHNKSTKISNVKHKLGPRRDIIVAPLKLANADNLIETVFTNEHINIYKDDYGDLNTGARSKFNPSGEMERFLTCSELGYTKGKLVGDCAWSYYTSGILAVCYTDYEPSSINYKRTEEIDTIADQGAPPVLVWSYTDGLRPKLLLQTPREVTCLSWCPYQRHVLIGGTISGQIIVWNIGNKIIDIDTPEILTLKQKENRTLLLSCLNWMKITDNPSEVKPSMISNLIYSHKSTVTHITWLPKNCDFTKHGKIHTENTQSRQFQTSSEDGTMLVWNLNIKTDDMSSRRKSRRLTVIPSELKQDKIGVAVLSKNFKPHYKITIDNFPLLLIKNLIKSCYQYKPIHNYFDPRPHIRTEYKLSEDDAIELDNKNYILTGHKYVLGTPTGELYSAQIGGYDFNGGASMNTEKAETHKFMSIHDGPITHIEAHPVSKDFFLTIGGTVFTIWKDGLYIPIFWRKASNCLRYTNGGWVTNKPSYIMTIRSDGVLELWDLVVSVKEPVKTVTMGGDILLQTFGFQTPLHATKGTIAFSDNFGTLTVYHFPEYFKYQSIAEQEAMQHLLSTGYENKTIIHEWIEKFEEHFYLTEQQQSKYKIDSLMQATIKAKSVPKYKKNVYFSQIEKMNKVFEKVQWKSREQKYMFETIMERKRFDLKELESFKNLIVTHTREYGEKWSKEQKMIMSKQNTFLAKATSLLQGRKSLHHHTKAHRITSKKDELEYDSFLKGYDTIEEAALFYIENHKYESKFNWQLQLSEAISLRKLVTNFMRENNLSLKLESENRRDTLKYMHSEIYLQQIACG